MTNYEQEILNTINNSANPDKAIEIAIAIVLSVLKSC